MTSCRRVGLTVRHGQLATEEGDLQGCVGEYHLEVVLPTTHAEVGGQISYLLFFRAAFAAVIELEILHGDLRPDVLYERKPEPAVGHVSVYDDTRARGRQSREVDLQHPFPEDCRCGSGIETNGPYSGGHDASCVDGERTG